MKKVIQIAIALYLVIQINLQAQGWDNINPIFEPSGNYNTYYGAFVDEKHGWWMAGPNGSVFYTTDGGILWKEQHNNIAFGNIEFIDTSHGWIVGESLPDHQSFILITKDGGESWDKYTTPFLGCITFSDSLNGFAGGDSIYSTTDGGITWCPQEVEPGVSFGITDIYFIDDQNGWAVGGSSTAWDSGIILNTTNGGKYWNVNRHPTGISGQSVYFTDSLHGYIVGVNPPYFSGVIAVTNDGGLNWEIYYPPAWFNDVVFVNDSTGWVVGKSGYILHTSDRGVTWTQIESGTTSDLYRIFFFNKGEVGYIFGSNSTLLKYDKTVGIKDQSQPITSSFNLFQNYPNPFNPTTQIKFQIALSGQVTLIIYNILGKEVITLVDEEKQPGSYTVTWNGKSKNGKKVRSGVYFCTLITEHAVVTNKLLHLK